MNESLDPPDIGTLLAGLDLSSSAAGQRRFEPRSESLEIYNTDRYAALTRLRKETSR